MYLTYAEYLESGGTLDSAAFTIAEKKARYLINSKANGRTGERIAKLTELPEAVKDCMFELIELSQKFPANEKQILSESQSQGGVNESVSYETKSAEDIRIIQENIIHDCFYGGGIGDLLYKGADI